MPFIAYASPRRSYRRSSLRLPPIIVVFYFYAAWLALRHTYNRAGLIILDGEEAPPGYFKMIMMPPGRGRRILAKPILHRREACAAKYSAAI